MLSVYRTKVGQTRKLYKSKRTLFDCGGTIMNCETFDEFWEELKRESPETKAELEKIEQDSELMNEVIVGVKNLLDEQDRDNWVDATDYLPMDGKNVLCWYEYFRYGEYNRMFQTYGIGYQYNGSWGGEVSNGTKAKVLAWRELPKPPKTNGEETK